MCEDDFPFAVQVAHDVLDMHAELLRLRKENEELREYRKKYLELLDNSIAHGERMVGGILQLALTPGVTDAIAAAGKSA